MTDPKLGEQLGASFSPGVSANAMGRDCYHLITVCQMTPLHIKCFLKLLQRVIFTEGALLRTRETFVKFVPETVGEEQGQEE